MILEEDKQIIDILEENNQDLNDDDLYKLNTNSVIINKRKLYQNNIYFINFISLIK